MREFEETKRARSGGRAMSGDADDEKATALFPERHEGREER